jgi:hypothetical protein
LLALIKFTKGIFDKISFPIINQNGDYIQNIMKSDQLNQAWHRRENI